jgi:23S rRNA (cytosine1962-C5)-methyltransferase
MIVIQLKPGREKALQRGHPWLFSGSIDPRSDSERVVAPGETVKIVDSKQRFQAWGSISPKSKIRVRIWSRKEEAVIGPEFFHERLTQALNFRKKLFQDQDLNGFRLVHAESDGLPGLIADIYGKTLVIQFLTCGAEYWRDILVEQLSSLSGCVQAYERSDSDIRQLEGLEPRTGPLLGERLDNPVKIVEGDLSFWVDIVEGQKTGFYLDQRENRSIIRQHASEKNVLDCFAYTGGFTISALAGGAKSVIAVDSSSEAIQSGAQNLRLNQFSDGSTEWIKADVFTQLREFRNSNQKFDMVILDPPKFAPTAAHAQRAARGYKDINLLAMKLLNPGGLLATFSCSGGVGEELFQKIVAGAALDAGVQGKIIRKLGPGGDHPVALNFPEGAYLKGLLVHVN